MVHLTQSGVVVPPDAVSQLGAEFNETGCAMLPGFLTGRILKTLMRQLEAGMFAKTDEVQSSNGRIFGTTMKLPQSDRGVVALNFILNRPDLFELVAQIAATPPLHNFLGRLHRTTAGTDEQIGWHDDSVDFRTVALDINLSAGEYSGGVFQIRRPDQQITREVNDWRTGDAFLFRIGQGWQHRITPVESGERTVGVGWYRTQPDWYITQPDWRTLLKARPHGDRATASPAASEVEAGGF
jgi:hypothetical protein